MYKLLLSISVLHYFHVCIALGGEESLFIQSTKYPQQPLLELVHDAVFSPGGEYIGIGTKEGFLLYERTGMRQIFFHNTPGEVYFLKWLPDGERILIAHWHDDVPTYTILDVRQKKVVCEYQEEIRWFYEHGNGYEGIFLHEEIYPISKLIGHANSMAFSPDGRIIAMISPENRIIFRETDTGAIINSFVMEGEGDETHLHSIGYTFDGRHVWIGTLNGWVYFWSISEEKITKSSKMITNSITVDTPGSLKVIDITQDEEYALVASRTENVYGTCIVTLQLYLFDLEAGTFIERVAVGGVEDCTKPTLRAIYPSTSQENKVYALGFFPQGDTSLYEYDFEKLTQKRFYLYSLEQNLPDTWFDIQFTAQPFSPDGKEFLLLEDDQLYVVSTETLEYELITVRPTEIQEYQLHE